jgi:hypothetical protein
VGVHLDNDHYKWWALSCTSLGMLLATINSGGAFVAAARPSEADLPTIHAEAALP